MRGPRDSGREAGKRAASIPTTLLERMYATMVRIRLTEERVAELLVAKEIGCPTHLCTGQEAVAAGVCATLDRADYIFGGHRSHGHYLAKGGDLNALVAELYGKETGCARGRGGSMHLVAPEVGILGTVPIVAATIPMAVGTALASHLRRDGRVTVAFFGDGAVEEGTFHESMNLAASRSLPVVFVCENNLYASHLQLLERRVRDNIVKSAEAHGLPGLSVDGNDVVAVYRASGTAVERARGGGGPTLLECRTYRWHGHVGPALDLDVGVKRREELAEWCARDPIPRLERLLLARGMSADAVRAVRTETEKAVEEAVAFARASAYPSASELGRFVYSSADGRSA